MTRIEESEIVCELTLLEDEDPRQPLPSSATYQL